MAIKLKLRLCTDSSTPKISTPYNFTYIAPNYTNKGYKISPYLYYLELY